MLTVLTTYRLGSATERSRLVQRLTVLVEVGIQVCVVGGKVEVVVFVQATIESSASISTNSTGLMESYRSRLSI